MRAALILMAIAFAIAIVKAAVGSPAIDGVTFLVFLLVVASLAAYYRWSVAPRRDR